MSTVLGLSSPHHRQFVLRCGSVHTCGLLTPRGCSAPLRFTQLLPSQFAAYAGVGAVFGAVRAASALAPAALSGSRAAAPEAPAALTHQHGRPTTRSARVRGARPMIGARASACLDVARLLLALLFWAVAAAPASGSQVLRCQVWRSWVARAAP